MNETADFWYTTPLPIFEREKPYYNFINDSSNMTLDKFSLSVLDVRGRESEFKLGVHGFEYRRRPLPLVNWEDHENIRKNYVEDLKMLARKLVPETVEDCILFDYQLRSSLTKETPPEPLATDKLPPARMVHIDQSPIGALNALKRKLGEKEAARVIENYRVRIVNIWRPLIDIVEDSPLAMCDVRTVKQSDLIQSNSIGTAFVRSNYLVQHNPNHQFYYLSRQTKDELCAFMIFDSYGVGKDEILTPPHSAFWHSEKWRSDKCPRESIEARFMIFTLLD